MSAPSFTLSARPCQATGAPAACGGEDWGRVRWGGVSSRGRGVQGNTGWSTRPPSPELQVPRGF